MAGILKGGVTTLHIERRFAASRERVYEAWTDPELFVRWFMPKGGSASDAEIDLRVGGTWRVTMKPPLRPAGLAFGTYMEVDPPARLVYTLAWKGIPLGPESIVTVEFHELADGTELSLTQERLDTIRGRVGHARGWRNSMKRLRDLVETG
jgi:uncharacterized protein YndB with AHSA1/START domain